MRKESGILFFMENALRETLPGKKLPSIDKRSRRRSAPGQAKESCRRDYLGRPKGVKNAQALRFSLQRTRKPHARNKPNVPIRRLKISCARPVAIAHE
jgi:hypothetical protein